MSAAASSPTHAPRAPTLSEAVNAAPASPVRCRGAASRDSLRSTDAAGPRPLLVSPRVFTGEGGAMPPPASAESAHRCDSDTPRELTAQARRQQRQWYASLSASERAALLLSRQPLPAGPKTALPRHFYAYTCAFLASFALFCVLLIAPMVMLSQSSSSAAASARLHEYNTGAEWSSALRSSIVDALVLTWTLHGYVRSVFPSLPPFNATPDASGHYNLDPYFARFNTVASLITSQNPIIISQTLCPGGIVTMRYPSSPANIGRNLFDPSDPVNLYTPTPRQIAVSGKAAISGPRPSTAIGTEGEWVVLSIVPIYNKSLTDSPSLENFWGLVALTASMQSTLAAVGLSAKAQSEYLDYVVYSSDLTSNGTSVISTSLPANTSAAVIADFIADSTVTDVLWPFTSLQIAVRSRATYPTLCRNAVAVIILGALLLALTAFAALSACILWCRREYDAAAHAPKMAPFAMLTVRPRRAAELWDTAPEEMAEVTERAGKLLAQCMARYGAYPIQGGDPFTACYATRSVSSAVQMALYIIEDAASHPIDGPLRAALGEDVGRLEVGCTVHWCTDAAVRVESLQGSYRYEGPDVVLGGRMWAFAAPGAVTVSAAVVAQLPCHGLAGVVAHEYQTVDSLRTSFDEAGEADGASSWSRGVASPHDNLASHVSSADSPRAVGQLYLLVHPAQPALVAAAAAAITAVAATAPMLVPDDAESVMQSTLSLPSLSLAPHEHPSMPHLFAADAAASCHAAHTWDAAPVEPPLAERGDAAPVKPHRRASLVCRVLLVPPLTGGVTDTLRAGQATSTQRQLCFADGLHPFSPPFRGSTSVSRESSRRSSRTAATMSSNAPVYVEIDAVTRALLRPAIPRALDVALRTAFDQHAVIVSITYDEVRPLVYYFYTSYSLLFRPLAGPERQNIFRRLVSAFGVPQHGVLEHLAARGAMQWLVGVGKNGNTPAAFLPSGRLA